MPRNEIDLKGLGLAGTLREISALFSRRGLESADSDARMLLLGVTGLTRSELILDPDRILEDVALSRLQDLVSRRLAGEPATRLLGRRAFWTLDLQITPDVLDPRPDSETIILAAIEAIGRRKETPLRILDLGTGSGALLLALLSEFPAATGIGVDLSEAACAVARVNAIRNGLTDRALIRQGRWTDGLAETFDLVVSNPPYIESASISALAAEVRAHDPLLALDGGPDGLTAYREITELLPDLLRPAGIAIFELGIAQGPAVAKLAETAGLLVRNSAHDLGGVERALVITLGDHR